MQEKYLWIDCLKTFLCVYVLISFGFAQDVKKNQDENPFSLKANTLILTAQKLSYDRLKSPLQVDLTEISLSCQSTWAISSKSAQIHQNRISFKSAEFKLFNQTILRLKSYDLFYQNPIFPIILPVFSLGKNGHRYGVQIPYQFSEKLAIQTKLFWFDSQNDLQDSALFLDLKVNDQLQLLSSTNGIVLDFFNYSSNQNALKQNQSKGNASAMSINAKGIWQYGDSMIWMMKDLRLQQTRYTTGMIDFRFKSFDLQLFQIQNLLWNQSQIWVNPTFGHRIFQSQNQSQNQRSQFQLFFKISSFRKINQSLSSQSLSSQSLSSQSLAKPVLFEPYRQIDEMILHSKYEFHRKELSMQTGLKLNPIFVDSSKFDLPIQIQWGIESQLSKKTAFVKHDIQPFITYHAQIFPFQSALRTHFTLRDEQSLKNQGKFPFQDLQMGIRQVFDFKQLILSYQSHLLFQNRPNFQINDPIDLYLFEPSSNPRMTTHREWRWIQSFQLLYQKQMLSVKSYDLKLAQIWLTLQSNTQKLMISYQHMPIFLFQSYSFDAISNQSQNQFPIYLYTQGYQVIFNQKWQHFESITDISFSSFQSLEMIRKINQSFKISLCQCFGIQLDFSYVRGLFFPGDIQSNFSQIQALQTLLGKDDYRFIASLFLWNF